MTLNGSICTWKGARREPVCWSQFTITATYVENKTRFPKREIKENLFFCKEVPNLDPLKT